MCVGAGNPPHPIPELVKLHKAQLEAMHSSRGTISQRTSQEIRECCRIKTLFEQRDAGAVFPNAVTFLDGCWKHDVQPGRAWTHAPAGISSALRLLSTPERFGFEWNVRALGRVF